jgi:hypothetical protein
MRFLCAACLKAAGHARPVTAKRRRFGEVGLALAGIVLAWMIFFCAGEAIMTLNGRMEQTAWQNR